MKTNSLQNCRLCLETSNLCDIFKNEACYLLPQKALICLDIKMQEDDGLPMICKSCIKQLNKFYEFRQISRTVHQRILNETRRSEDVMQNVEQCDFTAENMDIKPDIDEIFLYASDQTYDIDLQNFDADIVQSSVEIDNTKKRTIRTQKIVKNNLTKEKKNTSVQCDMCGKIYKHKSILTKHILSHLGIKRFSCQLCDKKFTRSEHVTAHMRAHDGVRPFVCAACGRGFTKRQDLLRHHRVHSDEKNFACPQCQRRFKRPGDVRSHLRSHTGARPYSCPRCRRSYTSHSGLQKHTNTCHRLPPTPSAPQPTSGHSQTITYTPASINTLVC